MDKVLVRHIFEEAMTQQQPQFGAFFLARLLSLDITYREDTCMIEFPVHDFLFNPQGSLHGGIIATIMDISMGHLIHHSYGIGGATLEMKVQYLRPLREGRATCTGRFIRGGRNIAFLEAHIIDTAGRLIAQASSTWKCGTAPGANGD